MDECSTCTSGEGDKKRFKALQNQEILRKWEATGKGVTIAKKHGILTMTLHLWRKRLDQAFAEFLTGS
ncbi:hypothetical protein ACFL2Q_19205 [Thermodesulfobacteriota bacterium]